MTPIRIGKMDETTMRKLRQRAARHGRSMNDEIRHILGDAVGNEDEPRIRLAIERRLKGIGRRPANRQMRGLKVTPAKIR